MMIWRKVQKVTQKEKICFRYTGENIWSTHFDISLPIDRARAGAGLILTCAMRVWFGIWKVEQNLLILVEVVLADDVHGAVHDMTDMLGWILDQF